MATKENAIRLALLQISVIVFAVLTSAACLRLIENSFIPRAPTVTIFMTQHGYLLLLLPLGWTWLMVHRRSREAGANGERPGVFFAGVMLFVGLCCLAVAAIMEPWQIMNAIGSALTAPPPAF
jgi:hypothetical protein